MQLEINADPTAHAITAPLNVGSLYQLHTSGAMCLCKMAAPLLRIYWIAGLTIPQQFYGEIIRAIKGLRYFDRGYPPLNLVIVQLS